MLQDAKSFIRFHQKQKVSSSNEFEWSNQILNLIHRLKAFQFQFDKFSKWRKLLKRLFPSLEKLLTLKVPSRNQAVVPKDFNSNWYYFELRRDHPSLSKSGMVCNWYLLKLLALWPPNIYSCNFVATFANLRTYFHVSQYSKYNDSAIVKKVLPSCFRA